MPNTTKSFVTSVAKVFESEGRIPLGRATLALNIPRLLSPPSPPPYHIKVSCAFAISHPLSGMLLLVFSPWSVLDTHTHTHTQNLSPCTRNCLFILSCCVNCHYVYIGPKVNRVSTSVCMFVFLCVYVCVPLCVCVRAPSELSSWGNG